MDDFKNAIKVLWKHLSNEDQVTLLKELHDSVGGGGFLPPDKPIKPSRKVLVQKAMIEINRQTKTTSQNS